MPQTNPSQPAVSAAAGQLSRRALASLMGRFQGPELFFQQTFTALTNPIIARNINLTRPAESIKIIWKGRIVVSVANYTTLGVEAPQTILQRIRLTGTHRIFNQLIPIDISGATAFAWGRLFQQRGPSLYINNARQPDLSVPIGLALTTFGNVGTYDVELHYDIPLTPMLPISSRISVVPFMYYPQDWADTLQLQLFFGDATSFGNVAGATTTFSAFGSGAGSPTVNVHVNYSILGPLANSVKPAVVLRSENTIVGQSVAAVANSQRLTLLQKQKTMNVIVKSGTVFTGQSAGVQTYATLVDNMLDRLLINLDNKPVRNNQDNRVAKEYFGRQFNSVLPQGYQGLTFVDSMNPLTYYRGDQIPGGSTFELDSDVLTANANQAFSFIQEQVYGDPGGR